MYPEPVRQFSDWFEQARSEEPSDHDAVSLASVNPDGRPSIRMVLMRAYDERGFVFYTNLASSKAQDFSANRFAAMCFHWKSTARQVRIEGAVEPVSISEADDYFNGRPAESQIGAWASKQSQILDCRETLESRFAEFEQKFSTGAIPRPDFWSGFRLVPDTFEFWDKRAFRLHDRTLYTHNTKGWTTRKLYP